MKGPLGDLAVQLAGIGGRPAGRPGMQPADIGGVLVVGPLGDLAGQLAGIGGGLGRVLLVVSQAVEEGEEAD